MKMTLGEAYLEKKGEKGGRDQGGRGNGLPERMASVRTPTKRNQKVSIVRLKAEDHSKLTRVEK